MSGLVCSCASEDCAVNGCARYRALRNTAGSAAPANVYTIRNTAGSAAPANGYTIPLTPQPVQPTYVVHAGPTEDRIREIIREELQRLNDTSVLTEPTP